MEKVIDKYNWLFRKSEKDVGSEGRISSKGRAVVL